MFSGSCSFLRLSVWFVNQGQFRVQCQKHRVRFIGSEVTELAVHVDRLNRCSHCPPPSPAVRIHHRLHRNPHPRLPESDFAAKPQFPRSASEVQKVPRHHFKKSHKHSLSKLCTSLAILLVSGSQGLKMSLVMPRKTATDTQCLMSVLNYAIQ